MQMEQEVCLLFVEGTLRPTRSLRDHAGPRSVFARSPDRARAARERRMQRPRSMPTKLPHSYAATVTRTGPSRATITAPTRPPLAGAPPPEFDGPPDIWSPEHLLLASLGLCLETTFDALANRAGLDVASWVALVEATLDRTPAGVALGGFRVHVTIEVAQHDVLRAQDVLSRARHQCFVSNALRAPVEVTSTVRAIAVAA